MLALIFLSVVVSLSAFGGRLNTCDFSSDFAEKYSEARAIFAAKLRDSRTSTPLDKRNSGSMRRRENAGNWQSVSLDEQIQRHFPNEKVKIQVNANGKLVIHPNPMTNGRPVILFDVSGDYFRVTDGKLTPKGVEAGYKYYLKDGKPLGPVPNGMTKNEWLDKNAEATHFLAKP